MLKAVALALVLIWQEVPYRTLEEYCGGPCKVACREQTVPPGFTCAMLVQVDPPRFRWELRASRVRSMKRFAESL